LISREKEVQLGGIDVEKVNFGARVINLTVIPRASDATGNKNNKMNGFHHRRQGHNTNASNLMDSITKVISVDNNSPRDVFLDWRVYMKHTTISGASTVFEPLLVKRPSVPGINLLSRNEDGQNLSHNSSEKLTTDMIVRPENLISNGQLGIFEVTPSFMTIPAFKSAHLKCIYRNIQLGNYEALVMADVAYIQADGTYKYAPKASTEPGKWPIERPIDEKGLRSGNVQLKDLESVALFGIKAKCIEPKLSLDGIEYIRVKSSPQNEPGQKIITIAFLDNHSDAICEFTLSANPPELFKVKGSMKNIKVDLKKKPRKGEVEQDVYELKQTQQLMITIEFTPEVIHSTAKSVESKPYTGSSRRKSISASLHSALNSRESTISPPKILEIPTSGPSNYSLNRQSVPATRTVSSKTSSYPSNGKIAESDESLKVVNTSIRATSEQRSDLATTGGSSESDPKRTSKPTMADQQSMRSSTLQVASSMASLENERPNTGSSSTPASRRASMKASIPDFSMKVPGAPAKPLAQGELVIYFTNGMMQTIPIFVELISLI
jgi:hypothetical protein